MPVTVDAILGTDLTESSSGNLAGNFNVFYDNGDSITVTVLDDIDDAANIYSYFISGSNEDAFKADEAVIYSYFTTSNRQDEFKATGFSTHLVSDVWEYVSQSRSAFHTASAF